VPDAQGIGAYSLEEIWRRSRAGARAGAGFRFQDAAATAALVLCWSGRISGTAVVPEGLDDFAVESACGNVLVQVKSKLSDDSTFSPGEIAEVMVNQSAREVPVSSTIVRVVLIDRPFLGKRYEDWSKALVEDSTIVDHLRPAIASRDSDEMAATELLRKSTLITWPNPLAIAGSEIASNRKVPLAAALACVHRLMHRIGECSDKNAVASLAARAKLTTGDVEREIDEVLDLIDTASVETAVKRGIVAHIDFTSALEEPGFYLGVSTQPGHVAAGLTIPREHLTSDILENLFSWHRLLVTGPSGAGKSAAALMAAFETRHACRWIQLRRCDPGDREDFLRFLRGEAPTAANPIALYLDDVGETNQGAWECAVDASLRIPGVYVLATVREENRPVLSGLSHCKEIRPTLDEHFAEHMWRQLKSRNATSWISWQEPFERATGLLLEYAHILTQGRRLQELVTEQVNQRLLEHRDTEFEILRLTSAASSLGATVSLTRLCDHLSLTPTDCARALQRLLNEHLVRRIGDDQLAGLHELRSQCILNTCLSLTAGGVHDARRDAIDVVSAKGARTLIAAAVRAKELDEATAVNAIVSRLHQTPDPALFIASLERLKICALDREAEVFKSIADRHNLSSRQYFLVTVIMALDSTYTSGPLQVLGKIRDEFAARTIQDSRRTLLDAVAAATHASLIAEIHSAAESLALMRALIGMKLPDNGANLVALVATFGSASLGDIASFLAIAYELSPDLAKIAAKEFGGTRSLLDRLWCETPWALRPIITTNDAGACELFADLVAVEGKLVNEPDSIVFDYATLALALAPDAQHITSRPIPITGEPVVINGFSAGLKSFGRSSVKSAATIAWNRLLLHAVALRYAASSTTEVMQRRKESLEIALQLLLEHADRRCRSRKLTKHQMSKLKALELLQDFFPPLPLEKPETALSATQQADLTDPGGELVTDVTMTCRRLYDAEVNAASLARDFERIGKSVASCRKDSRWNYVGGLPIEILNGIEQTATALKYIFDTISAWGDSARGLVLMPSHQAWAKGQGLNNAYKRAEALTERKLKDVKTHLVDMLSKGAKISTVARRAERESYVWPPYDICVLVECTSVTEYYGWLIRNIDILKSETTKFVSLRTVPVIADKIFAQCATRIYNFGHILDIEFTIIWGSHLQQPIFRSLVADAFDEAISNTLFVYAPAQLIGDRDPLLAERNFFEAAREKAESAFKTLCKLCSLKPSEAGAEAIRFVTTLNEACLDRTEVSANPAVVITKELLFNRDESPSQIQLDLFGIRLFLIQEGAESDEQQQAA
jgi:hypothetical protein